jgi:hypothetical protein
VVGKIKIINNRIYIFYVHLNSNTAASEIVTKGHKSFFPFVMAPLLAPAKRRFEEPYSMIGFDR